MSGNLIINVVDAKWANWNSQTINVSSAYYQEQAHNAPNMALTFGYSYSCSSCGDPSQIIYNSTDPTLVFSLTHNSTYNIRVVGNVVRTRPAPPPQMIETSTTPFDNSNFIADAWDHNTGAYTDDADTTPTGINTGDGFSRLDEYRGFVTNNSWARTDPDGAKDVFVYDEDGLGLEYFPNLGLTVHGILNTEWDSSTRIVNFKGANNQCGILMNDGGYDPVYLGYTFPGVGTPNEVSNVCIYTERIREWGGNNTSRVTWENPYDYNVLHTLTAHELGHAVKIYHHTSGTLSCVMFDPCQSKYSPPSDYCTSNPGCKTKSQLH